MPPVGAAIAAFAAKSAFAAALVKLGGSLLLSAAARALMPKPENPVRGRQVTSRQPVAPREIVYGQSRKGGTVVFMHTTPGHWHKAPPNAVLEMIIVLAGHQVRKIGNIYFDGELVIPEGQDRAIGRFNERAYCIRRLGTPGQTAIPDLLAKLKGWWTDLHRFTGCAYIYVSLSYDPHVYPNGIPNITCDIEGKDDIYDPRTQQRGYTDNAALCVADYMSLTHYGIGAGIGAEDGISTASLIAAANVCYETVQEVGGGTDVRYRCNGVLTLDQSPKTNIEAMLTAMAGQVAWQAGQWHIYAGAYRIPTRTFGPDDFSGNIQLQTRVTREENFNGVRGQFISPINHWQPDDFPAYQSATYVAEDGGEASWTDISLPFTISAAAAQRLAKIHLERQRRQQTVSVPGKLRMWKATTGSVINLDYARFGFATKPFEVRAMSLGIEDNALVPSLVVRETSPLVYDHHASEFQIYQAAPKTNLPSAFDIVAPTNLEVFENLYQTRTGGGLKVQVKIAWEPAASAFVKLYQVEASNDNGATWQVLRQTPDTSLEVKDWQPGVWDWRVMAISQLGVPSDYVSVKREIFGLGVKPGALTGVNLQSAGGLALIKWDIHPELDVRIGGNIVIRHSIAANPLWSSSYSMDRVPGNGSLAAVPLKPGTYLLRAEDLTGNLSDPVKVKASGAQSIAFAPVDVLVAEPQFSGQKNGVYKGEAGFLRLGGSIKIDDWPEIDTISKIDTYGGIRTSPTVNLLTHTEVFTESDWIKSQVSVTPDATDAPNGVNRAEKVIPSVSNAKHSVHQATELDASTTYTASVYAKQSGYDWIAIEVFDGTATGTAWFNLADGEAGSVVGGGAVSIIVAGNGWYRCAFTRTVADTGAPVVRFNVCSSDAEATFTGDGTSGVFLWGAQVESGPIATDYLKNSASVEVYGLYEFASGLDFGAAKNVRLRSEIDLTASNIFDTIDERPGKIDDWADFDGAAGAEVDVVMEVRSTTDDPTGSPDWTEWGRLDNSEIHARAIQARARLQTLDAGITPLVSKLQLHADEVV
ncbi:phage head spike fiber domain-containing protein [Ruegeria arenilitoris]|uniref:phage head spike fiber domain-containing protein n=1 Tax=Ruegeria arenilitoris TaxID=1173585 RepID=UPI00147F4FEF|nr:phage tail protein [Ruegeria arenilitoris]